MYKRRMVGDVYCPCLTFRDKSRVFVRSASAVFVLGSCIAQRRWCVVSKKATVNCCRYKLALGFPHPPIVDEQVSRACPL